MHSVCPENRKHSMDVTITTVQCSVPFWLALGGKTNDMLTGGFLFFDI